MKDDKGYPYLRVTTNSPFPALKVVNRISEDGAHYLGPFVKSHALRKTVKDLTKIFPVRTCDLDLKPSGNNHRVCLDYHIGRCGGPCADLVMPEEYEKVVKNMMRFFNGNTTSVIKSLVQKMETAVAHLDFENAAKYRDQITTIQQAINPQNVEDPMAEDEDILGIAQSGKRMCVILMLVRDGSLVDRETYFLSNIITHSESWLSESLTAFIQQHYSEAAFIPKFIILPTEIDSFDTVQEWLTVRRNQLTEGKLTSKVKLQVPKRGRKQQLISLAQKNAQLILEKKDATVVDGQPRLSD